MQSEKLANCLGSCCCCPVSLSPCWIATKVPTHSSLVGAGFAARAGSAMATIMPAMSRATVANINARFILTSPFAVAGGGRGSLPTALAWNGGTLTGRQETIHMPGGHFSWGRTSQNCVNTKFAESPFRNCLENSWRGPDRVFLVPQSGDKGASRPVFQTYETSEWSPSGFSKQFLHGRL
jgi:hypothetical protein